MRKSNSNFKLSKPSKSLLATITDKSLRSEYRTMLVQAEIAEAIQPKSIKAKKESNQESN